ncbi:MAG: sigma 54-interacting transcriptional regulator [Myxococcota bacterium]|nr:sigma 54-interacting transcriptional regulator [Myxococcota bacterium]
MRQAGDRIRSKIIGRSPVLLEALQRLERAACRNDLPIVILGETGTGKELAAKLVHAISRPQGPFVPVNCGAISTELMTSEFFGHVKGAFTGAIRDRRGVFEQAHGGVLFLDEIGEMPKDLQVKLLRVLQEKEIQRVGSERTIRVDVRIVAATNKNLKEMVKQETFREDLYYRLNGSVVSLPPLRRRGKDILLLAEHFLKAFSQEHFLSQKAKQLLCRYHWPGNIRELEHVLGSAIANSDSLRIREQDINEGLGIEKVETTSSSSNSLDTNIVAILRKSGTTSPGELGRTLGIAPSTMRRHLVQLERAGVLKRRIRGRSSVCYLPKSDA